MKKYTIKYINANNEKKVCNIYAGSKESAIEILKSRKQVKEIIDILFI